MPLIAPLLADPAWKQVVVKVWQWEFGLGAFLGEVLNFVIIALVVFLIAKKVMKEGKVTKNKFLFFY